VKKRFWQKLLDWFKERLIEEGTLAKKDLLLFSVVEKESEVLEEIRNFYKRKRD